MHSNATAAAAAGTAHQQQPRRQPPQQKTKKHGALTFAARFAVQAEPLDRFVDELPARVVQVRRKRQACRILSRRATYDGCIT